MPWATNLAALAGAALSPEAFGEAVVVSPTTTVQGIFDLYEEAAEREARNPQIAPLGVPQQPRPVLYLAAADAAGIGIGSEIHVREIPYLVTRKAAVDGDLIRFELRPKPENAEAIRFDRWQ